MIKQNEPFNFYTPKPIEITYIDVGKSYISDYIYKYAGGAYIEYHNTPHIHMPLNSDCTGYLILGKKINTNTFRISAFNIPFGSALYIYPFVLHNDCFLVGNYLVAYTKTDVYSTVRLINQNNSMTDISIF